MNKPSLLIAAVTLLLLSYVLDAVVNPLPLNLATPYQFFTVTNLQTYPFTAISIVLKGIGLTLLPLIILSFFDAPAFSRTVILLVLSALLQLYAVQDIASESYVVPLEWSLGFTLTGLLLLLPALIFLFTHFFNRLLTPPSTPEDKTLHPLTPTSKD